MKPAHTSNEFHSEWHWGPLQFDGLLGLRGTYLCFHRHADPTLPDAIVDPAKPVLPLDSNAQTDSVAGVSSIS